MNNVTSILLSRVYITIMLAGLIIGIGYKLYRFGYDQGSANIRSQWSQEKEATRQEIERLKDYYSKIEAKHREENMRLTHELSEAQKSFEVTVINQQRDYEQRLLLSQNRAAFYQRQAEAGASECRDLASHTARLDRSIEEGRRLVRELRETLRLRESQLIILGQQLLNDRKLLGADDGRN